MKTNFLVNGMIGLIEKIINPFFSANCEMVIVSTYSFAIHFYWQDVTPHQFHEENQRVVFYLSHPCKKRVQIRRLRLIFTKAEKHAHEFFGI